MRKYISEKYFNIYYDSIPAGGKLSNQDCFKIYKKGNDDYRIVIADGVSASLMAGDWAEILVKKVEDSRIDPHHPDNIQNFELAVKDFDNLIQAKLANSSRLFSEKIKRDKYGSSTLWFVT